MSVIEDLYLLKRKHRLTFGRDPAKVRLGEDASRRLAAEIAESKDFFTANDRTMTADHVLKQMSAGSVRLFGMTVVLGGREDGFVTPEQADAIEGYRQVGPC